jgi:hypothetical protein
MHVTYFARKMTSPRLFHRLMVLPLLVPSKMVCHDCAFPFLDAVRATHRCR